MASEEAVNKALNEVEYLVDELNLPQDVEQFAKMIVNRWAEMNRLQSRPVIVNAAAAVVVACKREGLPYSTRDIGANTSEEVDIKYIGRAETDMVSELGIDDISLSTPEDYVERFVSECDELFEGGELGDEVVERTRDVLRLAQEGNPNVFSGRSPTAAAGAAIWIAARLGGNQITQDAVSTVASSTNVTIRDMANSIIVGVLQSDSSLEDLMTTERLDARLNQRLERSQEQLEA